MMKLKKLFMAICMAVLLSFGLVLSGCGSDSNSETNVNSATSGSISSESANDDASQNTNSNADISVQSDNTPTNNNFEFFKVREEVLNEAIIDGYPVRSTFGCLYLNRGGDIYSLNRRIFGDEMPISATYENIGWKEHGYSPHDPNNNEAIEGLVLYNILNDANDGSYMITYGDISPMQIEKTDVVFSRAVYEIFDSSPNLLFFPVSFSGYTIGAYKDTYNLKAGESAYRVVIDTRNDISVKELTGGSADHTMAFDKETHLTNLVINDASGNILQYGNDGIEGLFYTNLPQNEKYTVSWEEDGGEQSLELISNWKCYTFNERPFQIKNPEYSVEGILVEEKCFQNKTEESGNSYNDNYYEFNLSGIPSGTYAIYIEGRGGGLALVEVK